MLRYYKDNLQKNDRTSCFQTKEEFPFSTAYQKIASWQRHEKAYEVVCVQTEEKFITKHVKVGLLGEYYSPNKNVS